MKKQSKDDTGATCAVSCIVLLVVFLLVPALWAVTLFYLSRLVAYGFHTQPFTWVQSWIGAIVVMLVLWALKSGVTKSE